MSKSVRSNSRKGSKSLKNSGDVPLSWWESDERMTHAQTADFLNITPTSLSSGLSRGIYGFKKYRVGRRNYFRKSEVLDDIEQNHAV